MDKAISFLRSNREKVFLGVYFLIILVLAGPLFRMWASAWERGSIVTNIIGLRRLVGLSHQAVSISVFGFSLALLLLLVIDPKKRWQGFLLWIGTVIGLLVLSNQGYLLGSPNVNLQSQFPILLFGFVVGLLAGGGRKLYKHNTGSALEFRRASKILYGFLLIFVLAGLIEYHLVLDDILRFSGGGVSLNSGWQFHGFNTQNIYSNLLVSALFIITMRRFVRYDAEKAFFILGPRASGKSLFLIGAYLEALKRSRSDETDTPLKPSEDLMNMLDALDRQDSEWIVEATNPGEVKRLSFQYVHGSVFPTNIVLSAIDYAGEYLQRLPDALTGAISEDDMDTVLLRLHEEVRTADTLIFVVDVERFVNNDPLEISEYFSILRATSDKGIMIVATKADILGDEFEDQHGLEPHIYFEEFTEYVNNRLTQSENVESLLTESTGDQIHPVFYQTTMNENGDRVPMRDESASVMTVGYDELLQKIGRE